MNHPIGVSHRKASRDEMIDRLRVLRVPAASTDEMRSRLRRYKVRTPNPRFPWDAHSTLQTFEALRRHGLATADLVSGRLVDLRLTFAGRLVLWRRDWREGREAMSR